MPTQISMDKNIINVLNKNLLKNKFLPALSQGKIIVHLTEPFLQELLIDGAVDRRARHSNLFLSVI
ncbi:MAG: hypothetical protein KJ893_04280 [Candidatus Omnitrophica bacterium]|nr:hypothetical protein [Candidatus Omnitrophota bacterium]